MPIFAINTNINNIDINENEAKIIAENFIADMSKNDFCIWNNETNIENIKYLYDKNNSISAYCINLNIGYVIVAARHDYESLILEWSDEGKAIFYNNKELCQNKIIYLGGLSYFYDLGNNLCQSMDEVILNKSDLIDNLSIITNKNLTASTLGVIEDPIQDANSNYAGPFKCIEYSNLWSSYATNTIRCKDYNNYNNHCGPVAVSNLILLYGLKNNISSITKDGKDQIFNKVVECGQKNLYYLNSSSNLGGTSDLRAGNYIKKAFSLYDIDVTTNSRKNIDYANIKSTLTDGNLAYLLLVNHETYENHHVVCYAYTRLQSSSTGAYKTYLKIADGWESYGRYLDLASLNGMKYWPVILP